MKVEIESSLGKALELYSWPGNVRELKNSIEYAAERATDNLVEWRNLPSNLTEKLRAALDSKSTLPTSDKASTFDLEELAAMSDPPLQDGMTVISETLRKSGTTKQWRRDPNCNALAILAARLRRKQPKPTWNELVKGTGVSEPVLRDMVEHGEKLLAEAPPSGGEK